MKTSFFIALQVSLLYAERKLAWKCRNDRENDASRNGDDRRPINSLLKARTWKYHETLSLNVVNYAVDSITGDDDVVWLKQVREADSNWTSF